MNTLSTITLTDDVTGATAEIMPDVGFNCFRFTAVTESGPVEVLWSEEAFSTGERRSSSSGIPILFPFPGRLPGREFEYEGQKYPLRGMEVAGNAIHGFVLDRPWRVIEQTSRHAVGQFQASVDDPTVLEQWPADFQITASYTLHNGRLMFSVLVENPDTRPLPFGLGLHPYFRVPLGGGDAEQCRVTVPVGGYWELADMLPTGAVRPAAERGKLADGMTMRDCRFDDVFTQLTYDDEGEFKASIVDSDSGRTTWLSFDEPFRECVVYNPPHREAICIEPYTCVPNAYALAQQGHDSGHQELAAGMTFGAKMEIWVG